MLAEPMSQQKAQEIAEAIVTGRAKFGAQYSPPYRPYEIVEAVAVLEGQLAVALKTIGEMVSREELTLANRRLAACEARVAKLSKKNEKNPDEG
jgi:hypothetical protein